MRDLDEAVTHGRVLAWALKHASAGDPLPTLWAASLHHDHMLRVLAQSGHPRYRQALGAWLRSSCVCCANECRSCSNRIREAVPTLALADVLARARAGA
jgi:hypothetical protein